MSEKNNPSINPETTEGGLTGTKPIIAESGEKYVDVIGINRWVETIQNQKDIKVSNVSKDDLRTLNNLVVAANATKYLVSYVKRVDEDGDVVTTSFDEYEVPECVTEFILPEVVLFDTSFTTAEDLTIRPEYPDKKTIPSPYMVKQINEKFRTTFNKSDLKFVKLSELRGARQLKDLYDAHTLMVGDKLIPQTKDFVVPVPVNTKVRFLFPNVFTETKKERMDHWFTSFRFRKAQ